MAQFMKLLKLGETLAKMRTRIFFTKIAGWFGWSWFTRKKLFMALFSLFCLMLIMRYANSLDWCSETIDILCLNSLTLVVSRLCLLIPNIFNQTRNDMTNEIWLIEIAYQRSNVRFAPDVSNIPRLALWVHCATDRTLFCKLHKTWISYFLNCFSTQGMSLMSYFNSTRWNEHMQRKLPVPTASHNQTRPSLKIYCKICFAKAIIVEGPSMHDVVLRLVAVPKGCVICGKWWHKGTSLTAGPQPSTVSRWEMSFPIGIRIVDLETKRASIFPATVPLDVRSLATPDLYKLGIQGDGLVDLVE